ncbi:MAG: ribonuclease D [Gemmatimonadota bacterium]
MSFFHIENDDQARTLARDLEGRNRFALDLEAAGFHRYTDRLSLVQLTTPAETYVIDPFTVDVEALLRPALEDPRVQVVMHGADYDLRLLQRDLGIRLRGLFDTQIAAMLLGEPGVGLQALLESKLGVRLSKKHQRADWAQRPLTEDMLDYAADDTRYLLDLADLLVQDLEEKGRLAWADEENRILEETAGGPVEEKAPVDPVTKVKGARGLPPRSVMAIREALEWRENIARERDRAPFRVIGEQPLVEAALNPPSTARDLSRIKGFPRGLAGKDGAELLRRIREVHALPDADVEGYPKRARERSERPPPELEDLADRLKAVRNRKAEELGLERGVLMPNATVYAVAWHDPGDLAALANVPGVRQWQVEVLGEEFLEVLLHHG